MEIWHDEDDSAAALIRSMNERIELITSRRLPYEPNGVLREARNRLRIELHNLIASEQTILEGRYVSAIKEFVDTENVLFYNVGIPACACSSGLQFSRDFAAPTSTYKIPSNLVHCQSYSLIDRKVEIHISPLAAKWRFELPRLSQTLKVQDYWWISKQTLINSKDTFSNLFGPFRMTIKISGPLYRGNLAAIVKPLFDGVISSLHSDLPRKSGDIVWDRLAHALHVAPEQVGETLQHSRNAILGNRQVVRATQKFVAWNPADELCLLGQLLIEKSDSSAWSIEVAVSPLA